ncbi:MAG TPA: ribosome-associated translation inhibitor RaiA [Acidimicrobiales bacterium]|nr:ribosome-associated translation inhibitor RaiA [Acidimicrobiales bacterium]
MQITLSAQHTDLPHGLDEAVADTVGRLDRLDPLLERADVHLTVERNPRIVNRIVCEVTLHGGGEPLVGREAAPDVPAALTKVTHTLEHRLHKRKTLRLNHRHGGAAHRTAGT